MKIEQTEDYEEVGATYQCIEIDRLNNILKAHGINDQELRKKICSDYIFEAGHFIDDKSFESEGIRYTTKICFSDSNKMLLQNEEFSYKEYTFGDIDYYFDEQNEKLDDINIK